MPVNTRPVVPDITVATLNDPVLSTGDTISSILTKETDSKQVEVTSTKSTVTGEDSSAQNADSERSNCAIAPSTGEESEDKLLDDVDMTSKTQSETNSSENNSPKPPLESEDKQPETVCDVTEPANSKPADDIEMKEENGSTTADEKILEEMQTSPKNPAIVDHVRKRK